MNGKTKVILSIGSLLALLAITFNAGATWRTLDSHSADGAIHQSREEKERMIDSRVRLLIAPLQVELREANKKLDRLLAK